jgi:hypothetical protein
MATKKRYGYYFKGNKIGLVQQETNTTSTDLRSEDYGKYKSPIDAVADGLEIVYSYSPIYRIERTDVTHTDLVKYRSNENGKLQLKGPDVRNYDTTMDAGNYIVLSNAGRFNGLHKISSFANSGGTGDIIVLDTSHSGANSTWTDFEETVTMYYDISAMEDESFELDLPRHQANAVVYYLKAKLAEDMGELQMKEYYMREFKRALEKFNSSQKPGVHQIQGNQFLNRKNIG